MPRAIYSLVTVFTFVLAIGVIGCKGSKSKKSATPKKSEVVQKFEAMEKKACACKDAKCASAVGKEMMKLTGKTHLRPSKDEQSQLEAVVKRIGKCMMEASTKKAK